MSKEKLPKCVSKKSIGLFPLSDELKQALRQNPMERVPKEGLELVDLTVCDKCGGPLSSEHAETRDVPLFDKKLTYKIKVTSKYCSCGNLVEVDGQEFAMLNMGKHVIAYEMMLDFLDAFTLGRSTMWTYYLGLLESHQRLDDREFSSIFTYNSFRTAWYSFLKLVLQGMDISSGFTCNECGPSPQTVIIDGTTLGHRRWIQPLLSCKPKEKKVSYSPPVVTPMVGDKKMRDVLKKYCAGESDIKEVITMATELYPPVLPLLLKFRQAGQVLPSPYKPLFASLASSSPACSIIPPTAECCEVIDAIVKGVFRTDVYLCTVQEQMPLLMDIIADDDIEELKPLLQKLREDSVSFFGKYGDTPVIEDQTPDNNTSFYPGMGTYRPRGVFAADQVKSRNLYACNKYYKGHPTLSPGIFCLFCRHGICYGFTAMECHESPDVPFSILRTKFAAAPAQIVYDNACNLHRYCLRRSPKYFRNSRFFVDRLHWYNHKGCSEGYNLNRFLHLSSLNSQAAEQANSSLTRLRSMLSYMNLDHFMDHCKIFLWNLNRRKMAHFKL